MIPYVVVGLVAAGGTYFLTPLVRLMALRIGAVDQPGDRKVHAKPTPTSRLRDFVGSSSRSPSRAVAGARVTDSSSSSRVVADAGIAAEPS